MKERQFERWHPLPQFIYFIALIILITIRMNPILIMLILTAGILLGILVNRKEFMRILVRVYIPASVVAMIINPLFSHEGITIIAYFPDGNPFTLESVIFGISSGGMICTILVVFFSFNKVISADRIMYITGKMLPATALVISMSLRFIPEFKRHFRGVKEADSVIDKKENNLIKNIKLMDSMIMWSFEKSIDRSDSMRARGYGTKKRSHFSKYDLSKKDIIYSLIMMGLLAYVLYVTLAEKIYISYYPYFVLEGSLFYMITSCIACTLLSMLPAIDIFLEEIKWKSLQSTI